ncbi:MAG: hypothetical protein WKF58_10420 [Ilumatobacteraceae bacterium]
MRIRGLTILLATTVAIGATGCGVAKGPTADGAEPVETTSSESLVIPVGEQVASWSEGNGSVDGEALRKVKSEGSATLLRTAAARDAFVDSLPAGLDPGELASIDLDTNLLVVGAYPKCMEEARVLTDAAHTSVWFHVYVPERDAGTVCAWSPHTVEVWKVPLAELGDADPAELDNSPPD